MKDDSEKVEQMILNNFSTQEMKKFVDNILAAGNKEAIRKNVLSGDIIEKYKKASKVDLTKDEEEIIKTIYLYLCMEGNAEKMKKKMESRICINNTPYAAGSEHLAFLQWKKDKGPKPKLF